MIYKRPKKSVKIITIDLLSWIALPAILILVTAFAVIGAVLVFIGDILRVLSEWIYKFKER